DVLVCGLHCAEYAINKFARDGFLEEIAHRVDEDHAGSTPREGLAQSVRPKYKIKPVFKRVGRYTAKTFSESCSIAVVASSGNLGAAGHGMPSGVSPFDSAIVRHDVRPPIIVRYG